MSNNKGESDILSLNQDVKTHRDMLMNGGFGEEGEPIIDEVDNSDVISDFISMFGAEDDTPLKGHDWVVYFPSEIYNRQITPTELLRGDWTWLYGIVREETETVYIFPKELDEKSRIVGSLRCGGCVPSGNPLIPGINLCGWYDTDGCHLNLVRASEDRVIIENIPIRIKEYNAVTRLFSRNTGLLESGEMLNKCAVLVGCGSVGSFVAMELARSGVGKFVLCDTDTLEIHNICRHQCGFDDLGRYKVDAVKDKILNINPKATVVTYRSIIQRVPKHELTSFLGRNTIIIGGGDNRASADWACKLAIETDSSFVSTCCWTRAFAGEIFYWQSGHKLSCYSCAFGGLIDEERPESHSTYFGSDKEKENLSFEPGVAVDIDFVTIIALKLALDLLNRDNENYTPRVINYLRQYTWICNTNSVKIGGERAGIFSYPLQITTNLSVHRDVCCPYCGDKQI